MNILITGAPGSGKGTMSKLLMDEYGIQHVSSGDLFRQNIKDDTPIGHIAKGYIQEGLLVPDDVTIEMVKDKLMSLKDEGGYLLDGFPRTDVQAEAFTHIEKDYDLPIDCVINLKVDKEVLIQRITGRRLCPICGTIYNVFLNPPRVEGHCDNDGRILLQRPDDTIEALSVRLEQYDTHTEPMLEFYRNRKIVVDIDGSGGIEPVWEDIKNIIEANIK